ncbi:unnamed protein product [Plutella xylostella]|uniref:(diamondback moth) hypothetical protein n=1 Tax=Plutella xylostella TaxID=51655 RepID=A0A8S4G081_PLUXY|nr:unnamed protein product [Plutella xylostella]
MEDLLICQHELLETLKRAETNYKKTPKERIKRSYIETRLETLEQLWKDFKDGHKSIIVKITKQEDREDSYFEENTYETFEELYTQYKATLKEHLQPFLEPSNPSSPPPHTSTPMGNVQKSLDDEVKLPMIEIPKFSGKYEEWQTFYDLFSSLIHNHKRLSPVQKLHYLKGNLVGEPEAMLRNFTTTNANYTEAWNLLVKRYNNKRFNCNALLKSLFTHRSINTESASLIKQLVDTFSTCLNALKNMEVQTDTWDLFIVYLVVSKLDTESMRQWEQHLSGSSIELPTWSELRDFLEARFRSLEMIDNNKITTQRTSQPKPIVKPKTFHTNMNRDVKTHDIKCAMCSGEHYIYNCKKFGEMPTNERQNFVQSNKLCFNCLAPSHSVLRCRQAACCRRCGWRHHSLLHFEREQNTEKPTESQTTSTSTGISSESSSRGKPLSNDTHIVTNFSSEQMKPNCVLLATANVIVESKNGCKYMIRALLDQGSQASFVTEATVQLLNLKRESVSGWVSSLGDGQTRIKHMVSLCVKSRHNPKASVRVEAYVLRSLTTLLPTTKLSTPDGLNFENLELADPGYATPGTIDILLGAEIYSDDLLDGVIKHPKGNLLAQNTILGWVLSGRVSREPITAQRNITSLHVHVKEDEMLKLFWELENEPNKIEKRLSREEENCEEFYNATTVRDEEGRYVVKLPFKSENPECQNGRLREVAAKRFEYLERKLTKNNKLREEYNKVMDEYIKLEHMVPVQAADIDNPKAVYLPHHAVLRDDKDTTKVRVVFDASCKGVNNKSLNDDLLVGPKLQQDLRHILMRWRTHRISITADIVKMYRMVRVADEDTHFQRILWRDAPDKPIEHYRLLRLTFGTACAPYLAVKSLQRLADDEKHKYPLAAEITKTDFYIDDLLTGCDTEEEALTIYNEMNDLMRAGGFDLQKWSSNSENVMKYISENKRADQEVPLKVNSVVKILGVCWNRDTDSFEYTLNMLEPRQPITKRHIHSEVAQLYDPEGWIAPVVVVAKMIIQKLWKTGLDWDDSVEGELLEEWLTYRQDLSNIKHITIPRWSHNSTTSKTELHVFADASQAAYGAAVYIRVVENENVYVSLITAKTKVAPVEKQISIPRLELCGAAMAAALISEVSQVLNINKENLHAWTDSTIVLAWLKGGASRWSTFVSNRVSTILNILDYEQWGHVATDMNPADYASRGLPASQLSSQSLWWSGPAWLSENDINVSTLDIEDTQEEEKVKTLTASINTEDELIWTKFSNLQRMLRVISYCRRWLNLKEAKEKREKHTKFITAEEIKQTLESCIKQAQEIEFKDEIKQLKSEGSVPKKSKLRNLCPLLDESGILRVGGRIQQSHTDYDTQHPIILPATSHLSRLIIVDAHQKTMHGGPQLMLNYLRSKFWIMRARDLCKKSYRECVTCIRYSVKNTTQMMGQLPEVRLKPNRPFKSAGVDYAGPINIRFSPGRGSKSYKGYICLFVCMVTRAIHLEAVTDLTSKGFIAAFRRFTGRRGHCYDLYSDNGTNFIGADKQLREMFNSAKSTFPGELAELLSLERTTWHFIPPRAPNFGGIWESGVRSTKTHLKKVISDTTLTYEELATVLSQVEACLNSRPITVLSDNPNDPLPLTPGHFLIGEPLLNLSDENYTLGNSNHLERWRLVQKMVTDFWNRWYKEYLVTLNQRYKWNTKNAEPEIDDVVILKEDNIPPSKWILGKIVQKHVGPDNITRVVSVKCKNGIFKRPSPCLPPRRDAPPSPPSATSRRRRPDPSPRSTGASHRSPRAEDGPLCFFILYLRFLEIHTIPVWSYRLIPCGVNEPCTEPAARYFPFGNINLPNGTGIISLGGCSSLISSCLPPNPSSSVFSIPIGLFGVCLRPGFSVLWDVSVGTVRT